MSFGDELGINFPKTVKVQNFRLAVVYMFLNACAGIYVIANFYSDKSYMIQRSPNGRIQATIVELPGGTMDEANAADGAKEFCTSPHKFDWCRDRNCSEKSFFKFRPNTKTKCRDVCVNGKSYLLS